MNKVTEKVNELQEIVQASNERKQLEEQVSWKIDRWTTRRDQARVLNLLVAFSLIGIPC